MDEQERKFREAYAKKRAEEIARSHDPAYLQERARQEAQDKIESRIRDYWFYIVYWGVLAILGVFVLISKSPFAWGFLFIILLRFYFCRMYFIDARELQNKKVPLWLKSPIQFLRQFKERLRQKK